MKQAVGLPQAGMLQIKPGASRPKEKIWLNWKKTCARLSSAILRVKKCRSACGCGSLMTRFWPPRETSTGRFRQRSGSRLQASGVCFRGPTGFSHPNEQRFGTHHHSESQSDFAQNASTWKKQSKPQMHTDKNKLRKTK